MTRTMVKGRDVQPGDRLHDHGGGVVTAVELPVYPCVVVIAKVGGRSCYFGVEADMDVTRDSELDDAIMANRAAPSAENEAAVMAAMRARQDRFHREQADEFQARTR